MESDRYHLAVNNITTSINPGVDWETPVKKVLRTLQVNFPFLQNLRFDLQRALRSITDTVYESDFDALRLMPWLKNGTAIDIGANRGDTIQALLMRTQNVKVMAFEPNPLVYSRLHRIYKRASAVKLFNFGLGHEDQIIALHVPFYKNFMFDGLASFIPEAALGWLKDRLFFYNEKHLNIRRIDCCITTLDRFEVRPIFMKIDVQGFEHQVLMGALETIRTSRPVLLVETPSWDTRHLLSTLNFSAYRFDGNELTPGIGDINTFFIPKERIGELAA